MKSLRSCTSLVFTVFFIPRQGSCASSDYSPTFGSNGFANWGAGTWPPSSVGVPLVPQSTDPETLALHTASDTTSTTRGIGAARNWLLSEITELAKPSNGLMNVSMPCYLQEAQPSSGMPIAADVCNVQVEIKGAVDSNRTYVYTGHYDSRRLNNSNNVDDAPGADDNASAVAIALEMVRILAPVVAKNPPAASIIIAAVAGEEQGLYGSNFLAQTLKNASVNVQGNFNDDIVGSGSNAPFDPQNQHTIRIFGAGTDYLTLPAEIITEIITTGYQDDTPSRHLGRYVQEVNAGAANTTDMDVALIYKPDRFHRGGDHESFLKAGFPGIRFTEPQEDFYHQHQDPRTQDGVIYGDEIDYVDFNYTARVGRVNLLSLWSIANAPATPSNFTYDVSIGFLASSLTTPADYLENIIKLYWNTEPLDPLLDYYEIWTHMLNVGTQNTIRIPISKDNAVFGLRAVGKNGKKSPATYALAVESEYFGS
ncbi:Zn-dependent exopeptidase [Hyaloscypha variabilis]